jgi:hypothetical protein
LIVELAFLCPVYNPRLPRSWLKALALFLVSDVSFFYEFH